MRMSIESDLLPRLVPVQLYENESISHYLGRLRHTRGNNLPSGYALEQLTAFLSLMRYSNSNW
jgi:hypothetical protein